MPLDSYDRDNEGFLDPLDRREFKPVVDPRPTSVRPEETQETDHTQRPILLLGRIIFPKD